MGNLMAKKNQIIILLVVLIASFFGYLFLRNYERSAMSENNCIFCKIIARQIPSTIVAENDDIIVIKDINPKAPIHNLIIPKKHIPDIQSFTPEDILLSQSMIAMAQELHQKDRQDFRLVVNSGKNAGQVVFHVHMHYLSGGQLHGHL